MTPTPAPTDGMLVSSLVNSPSAITEFLASVRALEIQEVDARGMWATIKALYNAPIATAPTHPESYNGESWRGPPIPPFVPQTLSIISQQTPAPASALAFLPRLVRAAHAAAAASLQSSILAGADSEGDDYADVGVWIGRLTMGEPAARNAKSAVKVLGLGGESTWGIRPVTILSHDVIFALKSDVHAESSAESPANVLSTLLQELPDLVKFEVGAGPRDDGTHVPVFLLGRWEGGWCGLVSIAIRT